MTCKLEPQSMPPVLDACCGGRMFYFDKDDPRALLCDAHPRESTLRDGRHFVCAPDVATDFTDMPWDDGAFSLVVFDPPHLVCGAGWPLTSRRSSRPASRNAGAC